MRVEIYWIAAPGPGRVALMPRPRGGDWLEDEVRSLREEGVDVLVSLLEEHEIETFDLSLESEKAAAAGIEFRHFPIPDHSPPPFLEPATALVRELARKIGEGRAVAVHCFAGIGRSATLAAAIFLARGLTLEETLERLAAARGFPVPETFEQFRWLEDFARRIRP